MERPFSLTVNLTDCDKERWASSRTSIAPRCFFYNRFISISPQLHNYFVLCIVVLVHCVFASTTTTLTESKRVDHRQRRVFLLSYQVLLYRTVVTCDQQQQLLYSHLSLLTAASSKRQQQCNSAKFDFGGVGLFSAVFLHKIGPLPVDHCWCTRLLSVYLKESSPTRCPHGHMTLDPVFAINSFCQRLRLGLYLTDSRSPRPFSKDSPQAFLLLF